MAKYVPYTYNKIPITRFCYIKIVFVSFLLFLGLKISYITARTPLNMEVRCYTCAGSTKLNRWVMANIQPAKSAEQQNNSCYLLA